MEEELITDEWLKAHGWEARTLFYQVGGGEDEDDLTYFEKNGKALTNWYTKRGYHIANESDLTYQDGFPENEIVVYAADLLNI
ncbi:hypothetical protein AHMF7605_11740 [Adhaeribacter arboris]|uniref:Uncharacterized protein n=1 Tax=Adhaeribacter arboris TaxID=2072846 RepID=A0A2T2YF83_9BACT|nr:hypothetical protein [Adhaeribacter arboris]PSR54143.1 hypothetical protein AHMF7605_11740 [Adhaeribacter arboris]